MRSTGEDTKSVGPVMWCYLLLGECMIEVYLHKTAGAQAIIKVSGHQYRWLAGG